MNRAGGLGFCESAGIGAGGDVHWRTHGEVFEVRGISHRFGVVALGAAQASADDGSMIGFNSQPLGMVAGPDGTTYVSDYGWSGGIHVYAPGETRGRIEAAHHGPVGSDMESEPPRAFSSQNSSQ